MIVDPQIGTYATAYFDMPKVRENQYINIFGMEDIRHFMKTGHLPGVFDHYFYVESIELRKEMLENFHKIFWHIHGSIIWSMRKNLK